MGRLTERQIEVLRCLSRVKYSIDGPPSADEIGRMIGRRTAGACRPQLESLEKRGLVEKLGWTFNNARTWRITDDGREALSALGDAS